MGRVTALSRAVTTVTWMSHGSHEPDVDESRWNMHWQDPGTSASAASKPSSHWVSTPGMRGPPTCAEPDVGSRTVSPSSGTCPGPSGHRPGTSCASAQCPYIGQVRTAQRRSIMGNNMKIWLLLPILTCYCLFLPVIDLPENG